MTSEIPTEGHIPLLDITIPIHWGNHAILMFTIWFIVVPGAVFLLRFGKIPPRLYGIPRGTSKWAWPELPWTLHKYALYTAIAMSVLGAGFAMVLSGGFSGSLHAWFGIGTLALAAGQGISAWFRGSHGGRKAAQSDPLDRSTWGGDHFDMAPQRWWFEAWHKTGGYFALFCAGGAVATGLSQFWMPVIAIVFGGIVFAGFIGAVLLQGRGYNHDTYASVYGYHPKNPFNQRRFQDMIDAEDEKP